jgi:uncharacterized protein
VLETHVIVHGACYDGHGAAWVAKQAIPKATIHYGIHGNPIPHVPNGCRCYMIDISYPRPQMEELASRVSLKVLDHHKTAQAALEGFPDTVFDMSKSGAMLAWEEFFPGQPAPLLIQYVQDQDLWTWKLPESDAICAYLRSYPRDLAAWTYLNQSLVLGFRDAAAQGFAILRSDRQRVEEMCEQVRWGYIGSHYVPIANATVQFSAVGNALCEKFPEAPFAAYWFMRGDGMQQWGLRSMGDFDVSEIAKAYGGGGHKNAAGFQSFPQVMS